MVFLLCNVCFLDVCVLFFSDWIVLESKPQSWNVVLYLIIIIVVVVVMIIVIFVVIVIVHFIHTHTFTYFNPDVSHQSEGLLAGLMLSVAVDECNSALDASPSQRQQHYLS